MHHKITPHPSSGHTLMSSLAAKKKKSKKSKKSPSSSSSSSSSSSTNPGRTKNRYEVSQVEVSQNIKDKGRPNSNYLANFKQNLSINVLKKDVEMIQFEMIGIDASIANAFRRILISEIPTVAIETVYLHNNTSIIQDEVLAHRLGLIPIAVEPNDFKDLIRQPDGTINRTDDNTLVFTLDVTCRAKPGRKPGRIDPDYDDLIHGVVYSSDLKWAPKGQQVERYKKNPAPKPYHDDIILAKMRPGQTIHLEAHCNRGLGKDHAKFSPVCTASYRLMPEIEILQDVYDDRAEVLMSLMRGVFELVETSDGRRKVQVKNPMNCTMSRNFMMEKDLAASIKVKRIPDHFIFSVETVGAIKPEELLRRALYVLVDKCNNVMDGVDGF